MGRQLTWSKNGKMTIQLLSICLLFFVTNIGYFLIQIGRLLGSEQFRSNGGRVGVSLVTVHATTRSVRLSTYTTRCTAKTHTTIPVSPTSNGEFHNPMKTSDILTLVQRVAIRDSISLIKRRKKYKKIVMKLFVEILSIVEIVLVGVLLVG